MAGKKGRKKRICIKETQKMLGVISQNNCNFPAIPRAKKEIKVQRKSSWNND